MVHALRYGVAPTSEHSFRLCSFLRCQSEDVAQGGRALYVWNEALIPTFIPPASTSLDPWLHFPCFPCEQAAAASKAFTDLEPLTHPSYGLMWGLPGKWGYPSRADIVLNAWAAWVAGTYELPADSVRLMMEVIPCVSCLSVYVMRSTAQRVVEKTLCSGGMRACTVSQQASCTVAGSCSS